ncbi:Hypothetical protein CINCED_3A004785 [Cinara cedri]|uniref:Uncharacterized protein n=1 Tax=Cinara cedri TaxID=506608 RepID=A0A5E4MP96_9HEMI|nr:Hypothetical protein CINCED_3A004785 [Cinara cedri]
MALLRRPSVPPPPPLLHLTLLLLSAAATGGDGPGAVQSVSAASAAVWSKFGLVVQKHAAGESAHTTETSGIIMRAPDPQTASDRPQLPPPPPSSTAIAPTALGKSWTQISVTNPPPPKSSQLVTVSTPIRMTGHGAGVGPPVHSAYAASTTTARSMMQSSTAQDVRRDIPHRYQQLIGTSKPVITITFPPPRQPTLRPAYSAEQVTSKRTPANNRTRTITAWYKPGRILKPRRSETLEKRRRSYIITIIERDSFKEKCSATITRYTQARYVRNPVPAVRGGGVRMDRETQQPGKDVNIFVVIGHTAVTAITAGADAATSAPQVFYTPPHVSTDVVIASKRPIRRVTDDSSPGSLIRQIASDAKKRSAASVIEIAIIALGFTKRNGCDIAACPRPSQYPKCRTPIRQRRPLPRR